MPYIKNMNYYFNKQYFNGMRVVTNSSGNMEISLEQGTFADRNRYITSHKFQQDDGSYRPSDIEGVNTFELTTLYPGLLMGTGYAHKIKNDDAIKCGFSFDYVSGLPYLPGSSLKGMLRSCFPEEDIDKKDPEEKKELLEKAKNKRLYIKSLLEKEDEFDVDAFRDSVFNGGDVFLDVFPVFSPTKDTEDTRIMSPEFITPHNKGKFASPIPIMLIKVKPNVTFQFCFILKDYTDKNGTVIVSADDKLKLFKKLIIDMGIGAKTNVGFGKLQEGKIPYKNAVENKQNSFQAKNYNRPSYAADKPKNQFTPGKCRTCGKPTGINKNTGKHYDYCHICTPKKN